MQDNVEREIRAFFELGNQIFTTNLTQRNVPNISKFSVIDEDFKALEQKFKEIERLQNCPHEAGKDFDEH